MNYRKLLSDIKKRPRIHGYVSCLSETRMSPIQGLGLFAKHEIPKGEVVAAWGGRVATKEEVSRLPKEIGFNYALQLYPGFYLAERKISELDSSDFINHSCSSNCEIKDHFVMLSKRKIMKDEELTADFSNQKTTGEKFVCGCKSKKCKKIIYFD